LNCNVSTTTVTFRPETYSDLIGDVIIQCTANSASPAGQIYITGDVELNFSTNLTNRSGVLGSSTLSDGVLIINENHGTPTKDSTPGGSSLNVPLPQYGDAKSPNPGQFNVLRWSAVKIPIPGAKPATGPAFPSRTTLRVTNLRANVNLIGVSTTFTSNILLNAASVADAGKIPGANSTLVLAAVRATDVLDWSLPKLVTLPQCQSQNLDNTGKISGSPTFSIHVGEGFAAAFRPLGQTSTDSGVHAGEDGYPTGLGANGGGANQGTRIAVSIFNVPAGVRVALPARITQAGLSFQLVSTDQNGAGAYNPVAGTGLVELGDSGLMLYEVVSSDNSVIESLDIPVTVAYSASQAPTVGITTQIAVGYAPFYTSALAGLPSATLPQPRFVPGNRPTNAFLIARCVAAPAISALLPTSATAGSSGLALQIGGTNFDQFSSVQFGGQTVASFFQPPGLLTATIPASLLTTARTVAVQVLSSDGQRSNSSSFVINPAPVNTSRPLINAHGVVTVAAGAEALAPLALVSIYGQRLTTNNVTQTWNGAALPTTLGGTSVTVDGRPAYLLFVSPTFMNIEVPDTPTRGNVNVVVTTSAGASDPVQVALSTLAPEFKGWTPIYVESNRAGPKPPQSPSCPFNACPIAPVGVLPFSTPAQPGETVSLWALGFGPSTPPILAGVIGGVPAPLTNPVTVTIGGVNALVPYGAFLQGVGLYQMNIIVPTLPDGEYDLTATVGGVKVARTMKFVIKK